MIQNVCGFFFSWSLESILAESVVLGASHCKSIVTAPASQIPMAPGICGTNNVKGANTANLIEHLRVHPAAEYTIL